MASRKDMRRPDLVVPFVEPPKEKDDSGDISGTMASTLPMIAMFTRNKIIGWASVKHKSGLQILSSLFVSALDQRQANGTITSRSTFKPPPRVTLTDTKREAWLKDLGDSNMPLRRLSRTIPHGIRGKALLDHCLAKNIPTWRAVWLAKCVGANEIRAFKRKGTGGAFVSGGENKWIKDWTANVEQFVDSLINSCGNSDWKDKMTYGLQLVAHIYSDQLVDQDHFLDWIITSVQEAGNDDLPIWLLIVQKYWKDIPIFRRRGRRLAIALSEQLCRITARGIVDANATLWRKVSSLTKSLVLSHPACFLFLDQWSKYAIPLNNCITTEERAIKACFEKVSIRNGSFAKNVERDKAGNILTPRQQLIALLDRTDPTFNISHLSDACLKVVEDGDLLISTTIRWATTRFRSRSNGIYISTRLLRRWSKYGIDLDFPLLNFLGGCSTETGFDRFKICKLVSELVRSRHFSIGRYLQWLVARGSPTGDLKQTRLLELELLKSVPLYDLPEYVLNLRRIVLKSLSYSSTESYTILELLKDYIASNVNFIPRSQTTEGHPLEQNYLRKLETAHRLELSHWIRKCLMSWASLQERNNSDISKETDSSCLELLDYTIVTSILIDFQDFAVLADVLNIFIDFGHIELLETISETVNAHFEIFYALGAVEDLFGSLIHRFEYLVTRSSSEKGLLASLIDLAVRLPKKAKTAEQLRKELDLCEPRSVLAACSPVSDNMVEALQTSDSAFLEEVELLFNSGTSMDKPLLLRMFIDITKKLESVWNDAQATLSSYFDILTRLRAFDPEVFDSIMLGWLGDILLSTRRPPLDHFLPVLVCSRTMELQHILKQFISQLVGPREVRVSLLTEVVGIFMTEESHASYQRPPKFYRYSLEVESIRRDDPSLISTLIRPLVEHSLQGTNDSRALAQALTASPRFLGLLQDVLITSTTEAENALPILPPHSGSISMLDRILEDSTPPSSGSNPDPSNSGEEDQPESLVRGILRVADDFNLNICQLKLRTFVGLAYKEDSGIGLEPDKIAEILAQEAAASFTSDSSIWQGLLSALPLGVAAKFHSSTTAILFSTIPVVIPSPQTPSDHKPIDPETIDRLIAAINATERFLSPEAGSTFFNHLAEQSGDLRQGLLFHRSENFNVGESEGLNLSTSSSIIHEVCRWIGILAGLVFIHQGLFRNPKFSQQTLSRLALSLSLLLVTPTLESLPSLTTLLFDALILLSDALAPETRLHCIHFLRDQHQLFDARLRFVFGYLGQEENYSLRLLVSETTPQQSVQPSSDSSSFKSLPFSLRRWEMVQDATPIPGENDTSLSLRLFGARKSVL